MKFNDLYNFRLDDPEIDSSKIKRNYILTEEFKKFIEKEQNSDYLDGVFEGILYVITEGQINLGNVGKYEKFSKKPLRGLRKVHVDIPNIESFAKNVCSDIELDAEGEILTDDISILTKYIHSKDTSIMESLLMQNYKKRETNNWKTGFWLIYAIKDSIFIFLYLDLRLNHKRDGDWELFKNLLNVYPESYLSENFSSDT